ncbi:MAG TPA: carboxypeptidase regulatory-like domain-containing protein [Terriglobales bacterium]|nr:carboxypeptidase regulatory-like domain-containing protein [Terriglobales bacterium]
MSLSLKAAVLLLTLTLAAYAFAETLTGTVNNGTTGKAAAGDDVVLIKLANGMEEAARTKADAKGNFKFTFDDVGPHLIRAIHQGVTYHRMAPPGTTSVQFDVFDVGKKIEGISVTADVMRFQVENGQLEVVRLFAVNNESKPPKTQMNDHNFEFYLPEGAKVSQGMAKTANGNPLNAAPVPQADKGRYAFIFPLRPGETQFQVQYTVPYSGSATIDPKSPYGMQHFVVMVPKTMQFEAGPGAHFDSMNDPQQTDAIVQVAAETKAGQPLSFKISGTGVLAANTAPEGSTNGGAMGGGQGQQGQQGNSRIGDGPGGGIGPPIDAPDPLQKYRWWIIGGFVLALFGGAYYVNTRQRVGFAGGSNGTGGESEIPEPVPAARAYRAPTPPVSRPAAPVAAAPARPSMLLEALKEELFQLEVEHKQGKITQQEYDKAKAALDGTLERAIKREAQNA